MKRLMVLLIVVTVLILHNTVFAMQFSEPILIGEVIQNSGFPYKAKDALSSSQVLVNIKQHRSNEELYKQVENSFYDFKAKSGIVRYYGTKKFGSCNDDRNIIDVGFSGTKIYEISSDNGGYFYVLIGYVGSETTYSAEIIGKGKDNKFIEYVNRKAFIDNWHYDDKHYGGIGNRVNASVYGDALILNGISGTGDAKWQYILKWDNTAQWFGIEYREL